MARVGSLGSKKITSRDDILRELAVGINEDNAVAVCDVVGNHIPHERTFAGAGRAEYGYMERPRLGRHRKLILRVEGAQIMLDADGYGFHAVIIPRGVNLIGCGRAPFDGGHDNEMFFEEVKSGSFQRACATRAASTRS